MESRCDESGDVRHVDHQVSADALRDRAESLKVDDARISGRSGDDELRLVLFREGFDLVVVDHGRVVVDTIWDEVVEHTGDIDRAAVSEVSSMREVHAEDGVAGLQEREIYRGVSLSAGVRLNVRVLGAE